jgi:hypothetical protein
MAHGSSSSRSVTIGTSSAIVHDTSETPDPPRSYGYGPGSGPRASAVLARAFEDLTRQLRWFCRSHSVTEKDRAWVEERINHLRTVIDAD